METAQYTPTLFVPSGIPENLGSVYVSCELELESLANVRPGLGPGWERGAEAALSHPEGEKGVASRVIKDILLRLRIF